MYYFSDKAPNPQDTLNINCEYFSYDGADELPTSQKIAFHHHHHEAVEILAVKKGELKVVIDDRKYELKNGDAVIINPYSIHFGTWIKNDQPNEYVCITFSLNKWLDFHRSVLSRQKKHLHEGTYRFDEFYTKDTDKEVYTSIENISSHFSGKDATSECRLAAEVYRLFAELFSGHYRITDSAQNKQGNIEFRTAVSRYLSSHYTENISTSDIASAFYMSVPTFCYQFKKHFGKTFLDYLSQYRITRAIEIYRENETTLLDLASSVGFYDYCYFSRVFHKYMGESPSAYFKK